MDPGRAGGLRALTYRAGDSAVIAVEGWLDTTGIAALDRALNDALARGHRNLVLDLHQLRRIDHEAVGVLWAGLRSALRRGGTVTTAGARSSLRPALEPLVSHGLQNHETVRAAIAAGTSSGARHP